MKAVIIGKDQKLQLASVPAPQMGPDRVLIDIRAAGVNRADLLQVDGKYPPPPGWPDWPGLECAGVVAEAPAGSRFRKGDKVCALLGGGGYAEQVAVPEMLVMPLPEDCSFEEGAALPEVFATAFLNLTEVGHLRAGETLFMQAGASGLGLAVIQLAKQLGAKVVTTVSSDAKAEAVLAAGADTVINRKRENVPEALKRCKPDVAIDCVGGPLLEPCLEAMNRGGRWIIIATLGGPEVNISLRTFMQLHVSLIGSTLRSRTNEQKGAILRQLESRVWPLVTAGKLRPSVCRVFPMGEAEAAHKVLREQANIGKVVLTVPEGGL